MGPSWGLISMYYYDLLRITMDFLCITMYYHALIIMDYYVSWITMPPVIYIIWYRYISNLENWKNLERNTSIYEYDNKIASLGEN